MSSSWGTLHHCIGRILSVFLCCSSLLNTKTPVHFPKLVFWNEPNSLVVWFSKNLLTMKPQSLYVPHFILPLFSIIKTFKSFKLLIFPMTWLVYMLQTNIPLCICVKIADFHRPIPLCRNIQGQRSAAIIAEKSNLAWLKTLRLPFLCSAGKLSSHLQRSLLLLFGIHWFCMFGWILGQEMQNIQGFKRVFMKFRQ